jgi:two-component system, cell cycle response regulator
VDAHPPSPERSLSVLLVEDSRTDAELFESLLQSSGAARFAVTVVPSLAEALVRLARRPPDVAVVDLTLPDSEGLATFRAVRNRGPDVPVVVVTGLAETGLGQVAVQQGAQDFLAKGSLSGDRLAETLLFAVERAHRAGSHSLRDPLTGLATAPLLNERIAEALARTEREKRAVAVLLIGLGGFAALDQQYGPAAGEAVLFGVAGRLCDVFPPPAAVGRVTVDEFAVVLEGLMRPSNAERAAQRALGALAPEFKLSAGSLRVPGYVGIALGRAPGDADGLLDRARGAMNEQRRTGEQGMRLAGP